MNDREEYEECTPHYECKLPWCDWEGTWNAGKSHSRYTGHMIREANND